MVTIGALLAEAYPTDDGAWSAYLIVFGAPLVLALVISYGRVSIRRRRSGRSAR